MNRFGHHLALSALLACLLSASDARAQSLEYNVYNRWLPWKGLHVENLGPAVEFARIYSVWDSAQWAFDPVGTGTFQIRNRWTGQTLHLDGATGELEYGYGSHTTGVWALENVGRHVRLRNESTGDYVHVQGNPSYARAGFAYASWRSAQWRLLRRCNLPFAAGRTSVTLDIDGVDRRFVVYVPSGYDGTEGLPMTFLNHGTGYNPEGFLSSTGAEADADARDVIIVALAGYQAAWNTPHDPAKPDDMVFAEAALDWATENLCVDPHRVFAAGFSGGARTASRMACTLDGRIRGLAAVAGVRHDSPCEPTPLGVLAIHGTGDTTNPYAGGNSTRWGESVEDAVADWVDTDGCSTSPAVSTPSANLEVRDWNSGCENESRVQLQVVSGGGHTWNLLPDTSATVLDFFLSL